MIAADGNRNSPASVTLASKPKPASGGAWTNCGIRMNEPNIPNPTRSAVRLVVNTARSRIMPMSTSGSRTRCSNATHTDSSTAAAMNRPMTCAEPQPQLLPSLTVTSRAMRPPESRAAPPQSILDGLLIGDSGTNRWVAIVAGITTATPSQKSHS